MNNQKGVVLLSVMILTTMTSIIVLNSLRDNVIQERLTGNYQKKMNARLVSEKGILKPINYYKIKLTITRISPKTILSGLVKKVVEMYLVVQV